MRDPAWTRALDIAGRQNGLITRRQCLDVGLRNSQVGRALAAGGRWQRAMPGVYAVFTGPLGLPHLATAALLLCGPSAQLTGLTALTLLGCVYLPPTTRVHVLVDAAVQRVAGPHLHLHRTDHLPTPQVRRGFPLSPPERAAILASRHLRSLREVRSVLAEVVQRRLTTVDRLVLALEDGNTRGSALPRLVLAELADGVRSAPEAELRDLVLAHPLLRRGVQWNLPLRVHGVTGPIAVVVDACWPAARLVVEVDSVAHHGLGDGPEYTSRRRAALVAAGWVVLSVSPRRIREEPDVVVAEILAVLTRDTRPAA